MDQKSISQNSIQSFSVAAAIFGVFSLLTFFTGILPIFTGGMGLLFVALSHRKGSPLTMSGRIGLYMCVIGILLGSMLIMYAYFTVFLPMMSDPEFYHTMDLYYQNNFGVSLEDLFGSSFTAQ